MKNTSITASTLVGLSLLTSSAIALAGPEEAPMTAAPAATAGFTGALTAGYDNRYIFRGLWFGDHVIWSNVEISKEIAPNWTFSANAFYTDVTDNDLAYSEANLGAKISYDSDYGTFDLGLLYYRFFDGFAGDNGTGAAGQRDATEIYLGYSKEIAYGITGSALAAYDMRINASYYELGLSKSWALTDTIGLDFSVATGFGANDYYSQELSGDTDNGFTHTLVSVAAPIQMSETVTLTPHVSANFAHEARDSGNAASIGDTEVFYGVSLAVSF